MHKMLVIVAAAMTLVGCSTIIPPAGEYVGAAVYEGYNRIADKHSAEFQAQVRAIWAEIDAIEGAEQISDVYESITLAFDKVIESKELTSKQRATLKYFRNLIDKEIVKVINNKLESDENAVQFLKYVREGIRKRIELDSELARMFD